MVSCLNLHYEYTEDMHRDVGSQQECLFQQHICKFVSS